MHLIFERSNGRFKSNCNILALAWTPYYAEDKFRQALFDYHQKQLLELAEQNRVSSSQINPDEVDRIGHLARSHNARLQNGLRRASSSLARDDVSTSSIAETSNPNRALDHRGKSVHPSNSYKTNRIDEFCKRCSYAPRQAREARLSLNPANSHHLDNLEQRVDLTKTIDLNYGRFRDFGWLVVGNVGKIIGVTLTSLVEPPLQSDDGNSNGESRDDLIMFTEEDGACSENSERVLSSREFERLRPDRPSKRTNHNLRGHLDEIILVKWNELYQKLATVDSKGNVLIWARTDGKFTIQTPFYNRTKTVADFKWSNDGKTALICYTDSFMLVGSSTGQRHWHSMLNLEDYHITCASWSPDDETLLLGVSNGNIVIIDLLKSELTEILLDNTNIRAMAWSTGEFSLRSLGCMYLSNQDRMKPQPKLHTKKTLSVAEPLLRRDIPELGDRAAEVCRSKRNKLKSKFDFNYKAQNILAIDFASNTIKLFDGGISDPKPKTVVVDLESYTMQWSSDGSILAVAGFNIHTSAPSVGCLKCRYLNELKFYNQNGRLIYKTPLRHSRYPITAITWAHDDQRLFVATGPHIHCAKVFLGVPSLELLATSCLYQYTRLSTKTDYVSKISMGYFNKLIASWQSEGCTFNISQNATLDIVVGKNNLVNGRSKDLLSISGNNSNVFQYRLPIDIQLKVDRLFSTTIKQPLDERWSMSDIIWHVPRRERRYFCTLVCYTNENEVSSSNHQYTLDSRIHNDDDDQHSTDQHKIFILYLEFQGSLIPILRARRIGFLKPEFVIFDPEAERSNGKKLLRHQRVSDISQSILAHGSSQTNQPDASGTDKTGSQARYLYSKPIKPSATDVDELGKDASHNCSQLHHRPEAARLTSANNFYSPSYGRSHHQEPPNFPNSAHSSSLALDYVRAYLESGVLMMPQEPDFSCLSSINKPRGTTYVRADYRSSQLSSGRFGNSLSESHELVRIKSNVWGTQFKMLNVANRMIRNPSIIGTVSYKASILHLQPRQIILSIRNMSDYCCLCSMHHHCDRLPADKPIGDSLNSKQPRSMQRGRGITKSEQSKYIMEVGDGLRIAPKLERNQTYTRAMQNPHERILCSREQLKSSYHHRRGEPLSERRNRYYKGSYAMDEPSSSRSSRRPKLSSFRAEQDDILTFTLKQGDQVRVEMSSMSELDNKDKAADEEKLELFLEANKALQSIQSITRRLEDMSKAASSIDLSPKSVETERTSTISADQPDPKSPKLVDCYLVPSTPVHRPRRSSGLSIGTTAANRSLVDTVRWNQTRAHRSRAQSEDRVPVELPPPPPSSTLRKRISLKARRLVDGSLRSLYSSSVFTSTDMDSEEDELLVVTKKTVKRSNRKPNSIQSQPATPLKRVANSLRNLAEIHSLGNNLAGKLRPGYEATRQAWNTLDIRAKTIGQRSDAAGTSNDEKQRQRCQSSELSGSSSSVDSLDTGNAREMKRNQMKRAREEAEICFKTYKSPLGSAARPVKLNSCKPSQSKLDKRQIGYNHDRKDVERATKCDYLNCSCQQQFHLSNRPPIWNESNQVYQLDFGGRVTQESAKNLQIDFDGNLVS